MSKHLHAPEITEEVIKKAFEGTNFGRTDYREFLGYSVLKKACHWYCGHTITLIMIELKLIGPKTHRLTNLGRMFLSDCYDDPLRNKPAPSAPDGWVKCSDRMPDNVEGSVKYLVYETLNERVNHDYWNVPDQWSSQVAPFWNHYGEYATHWMPLPTAPE